ncbi:1-acyl-sn-glycerol-3-phosphate acyltransferase [Rhodospira trueperi]|uniref:1-acyl-sn-glycerol-3-phosphate acyltransferase n=2 Tax=Rhodospira trueperi TaxID=69960 RepID=A0A1G7ECF6_9PROT|nr:1-acyl-sn-glycerol-3-phosphate acyltransferase [Rhodospira trueperi]
MSGMTSSLRALLRLTLFLVWTVAVVPPYALMLGLRLHGPCRSMAVFYWRVSTRLIGLRVQVRRGVFTRARPLLILSNHTSYLDIVVLGALVDTCFVAKSEVGTWPGFGLLARLGRTVFVQRKRASTGKGRDEIAHRLAAGEPLVLFPEGTSNDGNRVLPFKSALLAVAEPGHGRRRGSQESADATAALTVQPVSLAYTRLDGIPIGRVWRPYYAWYGDMDLAPHLWTVLGLGTVTAEVIIHDPIEAGAFASRKALTRHCQSSVSSGVSELLSGREGSSGTPSREETDHDKDTGQP